MRKLLVLLLAVFAISGVSYTQEVIRSLGVYLDVAPGHMTELPDYDSDTDPSRIFSNNEYEFGVSYSQNFATATWLSMWVKFLVVGKMPTAVDSDGNYFGNTAGPVLAAFPRAQVGLNFGGWAVIAMDTRGLIAQENYYTYNLPGNGGGFTFSTVLEFWAVPQVVNSAKGSFVKEDDFQFSTDDKLTVIDLFALQVDYFIEFSPGWRFSSKVGFRFSGGGGKDRSVDTFFQNGFHVRWENQVTWAVTPSFYMWGRVRYNIENLALSTGSVVLDVDHQVTLHAGLGYSFDFSDN